MNDLHFRQLSFLLFLLPSICFGQLSSQLRQEMACKPGQMHSIRIEFVENVDCYALNHQFKQQRSPLTERATTVIRDLQAQAELSQRSVMEKIEQELRQETADVRGFWIANVMLMKASERAIQQLSKLPSVSLIDLEQTQIIEHDPIIRSEVQQLRSPNGTESGLRAINAPAMWALGYTGRGRLVYDYDTGVWPTHPAFAERFLAHRFPMEQCWLGYFSNVPNGTISDHGTHTLGTIAGLVKETNDTIGVAFKSYWISNDFVTSTVEALPPLGAMMAAFEWALNPDGDVNTTKDIPDVINNSWRWRDDPDTVQCAGPVVSLMNAIEAAGIANVFSGGNSGPGNTTVNAPQRINTSEVNTFCVGSVDGNQNFPYPISNFSTRGPSQCPSNGSLSLEIHPEVVAPGQNVRSAWGLNEFNTISGTSMAAPHVSGAVLLLKEAFPFLSGEELLWALYLTAVDLGDAGEDNIYGMGMIDVHQAFLYLSQSNTPVDPNVVPWDLAITSASNPVPNGFTCASSFSTTIQFKNLGDNAITSINFDYAITGGSPQSQNWSGNLASGESASITLSGISTTLTGNLNIDILASISGQSSEYEHYNNRWHLAFNRRSLESLPFTEGFEYGFGLKDWFVQNEDGAITWDTVACNGLEWSNYSAMVGCYSYNPRENQRDGLVSPVLDIPITNENVWLLFDVAYQKRTTNAVGHDTLIVQAASTCDGVFDNEVYRKAADTLSTNDTVQLNFIPEFTWDWRKDSVSLNAFAGQQILLRFETVNRKGNNIFIDNVKVFVGNQEPASVSELANEVKLYPNPATHHLTIACPSCKAMDKLQVRNMLGQEMNIQFTATAQQAQVDISQLSDGVYVLELSLGQERVTKRFVKRNQ